MDRADIVAEMRDAAADFRVLLDGATSRELRSGTNGTKWTNEQLLFHMLFGYLVVRRLLILVRLLGRLPDGASRAFAATLNAGTRPFHVINYIGSLGGARVLGHAGMERLFDRIVNSLAASLLGSSDAELARGMHILAAGYLDEVAGMVLRMRRRCPSLRRLLGRLLRAGMLDDGSVMVSGLVYGGDQAGELGLPLLRVEPALVRGDLLQPVELA